MSKVRDISNLSNIIKTDASGNVSFVSGSTTLATLNTSGQLSGSSPVLSSSYALNADLLDGLDSTQFTLTSSFAAQTASFTAFTSSVNSFTASQNILNGTYATTSSNTFTGIQTINSNLVVTGSITAQTLVVQTITSSVDFVTGSTRFGSILGNTHVFSGSVTMNPGGLFVSSSGIVGIGTSTPTTGTKLDVVGTIGNFQIGTSGAEIFLTRNENNDILATGGTSSGITVGAQSFLKFKVGTSYTERMIITSAGNVGIGTTSPTSPLSLYYPSTGSDINYIKMEMPSWGGSINYKKNIIWHDGGNVVGAIGMAFTSPYTYMDFHSFYNSAHTTGSLMRIQGNGNVGIGTSTPSQKLEVSGTDNNNLIMSTTTTGAGGTFRIQANEAASYLVSNNARPLYIQTDSTTAMTITSTGKVGIGVTSPSKLFEVSGKMSTTAIVSTNLIAGQISSNLLAASSPNFILLFNMTTNAAGWSMSGYVNAAAWDCWNISTIWVRKLNDSFTVNAGVTGLYKSGCDFSICDITYGGARYIALRFTSNPEIDVLWTGYGLSTAFQGDGTATVVSSGVTVNTIYAAY